MKAQLRTVDDNGTKYSVLVFCCPGCAESDSNDGLHMLPVNTTLHSPSWEWNGDLELPTVSPSILSEGSGGKVCHSYLKDGVFQFLSDSRHSMAGKFVPMPDLPAWVVKE